VAAGRLLDIETFTPRLFQGVDLQLGVPGCESAPNFDPQPYHCMHLKDKRIDVIMRVKIGRRSNSLKIASFDVVSTGYGSVGVGSKFDADSHMSI
jgi:hypothetical protein